jgi:hypothetical protein
MAGVLRVMRPLVDVASAPFLRQAGGLAGAIALGIALYGVFLRLLSPGDAKDLAAAVRHAARPAGRKEAR